MRYAVHKYNQDLVIEADYFKVVSGSREVPGLGFNSSTVNTWTDVLFYRDGQDTPVAFVNQPYSVTEIIEDLDAAESGL